MRTLGERLRLARETRRMAQRDAAELAGVSHTALGKWERGESVPAADSLVQLANAFEADVNELLGYPSTLLGLPLVEDWPEGLREFVMSELAETMGLRPWEVGVLAGLGLPPGADPTPSNWGGLLFHWRLGRGDLRGMPAPREEEEAVQDVEVKG